MTNGPDIEADALWMGVNTRANVFSGAEKAGCRGRNELNGADKE
jgi:hypothetical protein